MKPKTEIFLTQCLWIAEKMMIPTWRNMTGSFEEWAYRNGMLRQIHALEAQGWLEARANADGSARLIKLTESGLLRALGGRNPEERWNREWDGKWRMVVFDVPESKRALRNKLRRTLRDAHFGGLQGSVWISPDPLGELAKSLKSTTVACGVMTMIEGVPCGGESHSSIVAAAWDFDGINQEYATYMNHLDTLTRIGEKSPAGHLRDWWITECQLWTKCLAQDPMLPRSLWPKAYLAEKAWKAKRRAMKAATKTIAREFSKLTPVR